MFVVTYLQQRINCMGNTSRCLKGLSRQSEPANNSYDNLGVARQSVKSSFLLTVGNFSQTIILAITSFIMARLLGPANYGAYSLAITVPLLFSIFVDFGAVYAIQRNASYYISKGDIATAKRMTNNAIIFTFFSGTLLSVLSFIGSSFLSSTLLHRISLTPYVEIASSLILTQALLTAATTAFLGWGSPGYSAALNILYSVLKLVLIPLLIISGFGLFGAILGYSLSYTVAAIIGCLAIYFIKLRDKIQGQHGELGNEGATSVYALNLSGLRKRIGFGISSFVSDVREIINYGVPAYLGRGISQFAGGSFVFFILSAFVPNEIVGFYQAANNIAVPLSIVSTSIGFSLFSAFSSLDAMRVNMQMPFRYSVNYVSLILMPLIFFSFGASNALVDSLYGLRYAPTSSIFSLLILSYLPNALGFGVFGWFFNGLGKTKLTLGLNLLD
jgi:stage V sporulation protein B